MKIVCRFLLLLALVSGVVRPVVAQVAGDGATLRVERVVSTITLDGHLDEPDWLASDSITDIPKLSESEHCTMASASFTRLHLSPP